MVAVWRGCRSRLERVKLRPEEAVIPREDRPGRIAANQAGLLLCLGTGCLAGSLYVYSMEYGAGQPGWTGHRRGRSTTLWAERDVPAERRVLPGRPRISAGGAAETEPRRWRRSITAQLSDPRACRTGRQAPEAKASPPSTKARPRARDTSFVAAPGLGSNAARYYLTMS